MGPPVTLPSSLVGIREAIKGNFDSKEMQRTATAGFYAGFVGQGLEYTQIISKADYQLSLLIVTQKGLNAAANPLTYVEFFRNFSPQEKLEAAKRTAKGAWNGEYDSALGRKTGAATLDYLLVAIGGALMKGESAACEVAESGSSSYSLLPSEGEIGTYRELLDAGEVGDNITPHHMPSAEYMSQYGVGREDGLCMNMEMPSPGTGGRHRLTDTYGRNMTDAEKAYYYSLSPRDALAYDIANMRQIYQSQGLYSEIRPKLQEYIKKYMELMPELFDK